MKRSKSMPMHAVFVNENTLDFIQQVNGGVRPAEECLETPTVFIHSDRLDDADHNDLMNRAEFNNTYTFHDCSDNNCNVIVKK